MPRGRKRAFKDMDIQNKTKAMQSPQSKRRKVLRSKNCLSTNPFQNVKIPIVYRTQQHSMNKNEPILPIVEINSNAENCNDQDKSYCVVDDTPSTPINKTLSKTKYKNHSHSQSVTKSKSKSRIKKNIHDQSIKFRLSPSEAHNISPAKSPVNLRKNVPDLNKPDDSVSPQYLSPAMSPKMNTNRQTYTTTNNPLSPCIEGQSLSSDKHVTAQNIYIRKVFNTEAINVCHNFKDKEQKHRVLLKFNEYGWNLLYLLIGFIIGCVVISVYHKPKIVNSPLKTTSLTPNPSSLQSQSSKCNLYVDKYDSLKIQYDECYNAVQDLSSQVNSVELQNKIIKSEKDKMHRIFISLREQYKDQCSLDIVVLPQKEEHMKTKAMEQLEHELGECNVALGACQQEVRQKSKLDAKRANDVLKERKKFNLCNKQLKNYKDSRVKTT